MLRIDQISISNYKNLVAEELVLNNFNIVVGPNNSGKSNFIQILSFLNHIINGSFDEVKNELRISYFSEFGRVIPLVIENKGELLIDLLFSNTLIKHQYGYKLILGWRVAKKKGINRPEMYFKMENFEYKNIHTTGQIGRAHV